MQPRLTGRLRSRFGKSALPSRDRKGVGAWLITCWLAGGVVLAQSQTEQLARIKGTVAENVTRLPDYTCTESIQQSERPMIDGRPKVMMLETTRMEVAFVDGKELFGWPGASKIDQSDVGKMIQGSIGNGYFGLFSTSIFLTPATTFQYVDATELDGKPVVHYDYRVPQNTGAYFIKTDVGNASVGFHGSFWVNPTTLDLIRIAVAADDIPQVLGISATTSILDFERQSIGSSTFVLPRGAELVVLDDDGTEKKSRLSFAGCHQFVGESVLKFDVPEAESAASVRGPVTQLTLPGDFTVDFNLDTPIEWDSGASGDPVHGTLRDGIRASGITLVPKGAGLSGRIAHLALRGDLYYVELTLTSLDFEGSHAGLDGRRNGVSVKGVPLIYNSTKFRLSRGARLTLHSRLLKSVHNDSIRP
jgi:hypothetical protein